MGVYHLSLSICLSRLDSRSIFLMDTGPHIMIYVGTNASPYLVQKLFGEWLTVVPPWTLIELYSLAGVEHVGAIPDLCYTLQNNNSAESEALFAFIEYINEEKPYPATIQIIR